MELASQATNCMCPHCCPTCCCFWIYWLHIIDQSLLSAQIAGKQMHDLVGLSIWALKILIGVFHDQIQLMKATPDSINSILSLLFNACSDTFHRPSHYTCTISTHTDKFSTSVRAYNVEKIRRDSTSFHRYVVQTLELRAHVHCKVFHLDENESDYGSMTFHSVWMHYLQGKMLTVYHR